MSVLVETITILKDVRHLGIKTLGRFISQPDAAGLQRINTRYGSYWIRPAETDLRLIRQIYFDNSYDFSKFPQGARIRQQYDDILKRQRVPIVIDAGANIGVTSRYFSSIFPQARIFAIEPDPKAVALCRLNTEMVPQVEVCEAAIGAESGTVTVESFEGHSWASRTHRSDEGLGVLTVRDVISKVPDGELLIVKVDIEGFEADLFSSNTEWISDAFVVIVELHDWLIPEGGTSQSLQHSMFSLGRDLIVSGENLIWIKR